MSEEEIPTLKVEVVNQKEAKEETRYEIDEYHNEELESEEYFEDEKDGNT